MTLPAADAEETTTHQFSVVTAIIQKLGDPDFSTRDNWLAYCRAAASASEEVAACNLDSRMFHKERHLISQRGEGIIPTPWGGVRVTVNDAATNRVEKFLVVDSRKFLAFEKHSEKTETLFHSEGVGILVFRPEGSQRLVATPVVEGFSLTLLPGQEHCLISLHNLLVFESGVDPKGMDQDLIFIYE